MRILKLLAVSATGAALVTLGVTTTAHAVTLTTNAGSLISNADSYVQRNNPDTNYGTGTQLVVKNGDGTDAFDRKAYVQFDLSSLTAPITSANFSLTGVASNVGGTLSGNPTFTFNVYGLQTGNQNWGETSITWNNAPANNPLSDFEPDTTAAPLLGTFSVVGRGIGTTYSVSSPSLASFLETRRNDSSIRAATFIIGRATASSGNTNGTYAHAFNSREAVPFEFSPGLGLLMLGACGAMAQIKRQVKNRKSLSMG